MWGKFTVGNSGPGDTSQSKRADNALRLPGIQFPIPSESSPEQWKQQIWSPDLVTGLLKKVL